MSSTSKVPIRLGLILTFAIALISSLFLTGCESAEMKAAKESFNQEKSRIEAQLKDIQTEISAAEKALQAPDQPLDSATKPALEQAINQAKEVSFTAPALGNTPENINKQTDQLKGLDFAPQLSALKEARSAFETSIQQRKQVTNPSEAFVLERLKSAEGVGQAAAVTPDNDPNRQLGKPGGYTAAIFFASPWVSQAELSGPAVIQKGTAAGGCIETYATEQDAQKRNSFLAAFDGTAFGDASHSVLGTLVIRTSGKLSAAQQKQLEENITQALIKLN